MSRPGTLQNVNNHLFSSPSLNECNILINGIIKVMETNWHKLKSLRELFVQVVIIAGLSACQISSVSSVVGHCDVNLTT